MLFSNKCEPRPAHAAGTSTSSSKSSIRTRKSKSKQPAISLPETGQSSKTIGEFNSLLAQHEFLFIVYYRVHNCPYCASYLRTLQGISGRIRAQGGLPLAITSQPARFLPLMQRNSGYTGRTLVDSRNLVALELRRRGLLNVAISRSGYAQPAVLVVRRGHVARSLSCSSNGSSSVAAAGPGSSPITSYSSLEIDQSPAALDGVYDDHDDHDVDDDERDRDSWSHAARPRRARGRVLYAWATKPVFRNMFGTNNRPSLEQVWANIDAALHGRPPVHDDMEIGAHKFRTVIKDRIVGSTRSRSSS